MARKNYKNPFLFYLLKFMGVFFTIYFVTLSVIALSAPGGSYYSNIIHQHFDYVSWLRDSLLYGAKWVLSVFGYHTYIEAEYLLKLKDGYGVKIVYSCLGYGIMSFWIAFVVANRGKVIKKIKWISGGLFLVWLINVTRISLLLVAVNNQWAMPFFDHHTWFNIFAYLLVFILIYFYDKSGRIKADTANTHTSAFKIMDR